MRLHDFFDYHVRERPDSEFAVMDGRSVTYSEASKQINRLATEAELIQIAGAS